MDVQMQELMPAAALRPFVVRYWDGTFVGKPTAALEQKVFPSGFIEMVLHLSDARCALKFNAGWSTSAAFSLVGFWSTPFVLQFQDRVEVFGIRLKPEALYLIFGVPAAEFINCSANLEEVFGPSFTSFCLQLEERKTVEERVQLADAYLLKRLYAVRNQHPPYVQLAADLIRSRKGEASVEALSDEVCISTRQLEREFKNKLGLSPKTYMRITRLNTILQLIKQQPALTLAQLSYLGGYADQAHFIHDFKQMTGELPSAFVSDQKSFLTTS